MMYPAPKKLPLHEWIILLVIVPPLALVCVGLITEFFIQWATYK